jgi:hypothetical protein
MASESGPFIVKDGLVLSLDAANERSFRGEPTVNLLNVNMLSWATQVGATVVLRNETHLGNPIYRVTFPQASLPRIFTTFVYASGEVFTGHFYYRHVGENPNEALPAFWFRENGFGATHASISMPYTTEFTFRQLTHTFSSGGTSMFLLYRSNSSTTTPVVMDFSMPQLEKKPYPTPWVNGTRGTTVATGGGWADLSKNNNHGEILNGVGYNSSNGGSLVFDGLDDYVRILNPYKDYTNQITVEWWTKRNGNLTSGSGWGLSEENVNSTSNTYFLMHATNNTDMIFYVRDISANTWRNLTIGTVDTTPCHMVGTITSSAINVYKNGVLTNTGTGLSGNMSTYSTPVIHLGKDPRFSSDRFYNGSIYNAKIYNRALTPQEIRQNFISTRRRFGL